MPFSSRNLYYLKINAYTILPVFLHLDEQHGHVQWMTEDILHSVIEDMRPLIDVKIRAEDDAGPKKSSGVDVHQGATYRFGYYLQKSDYHHVLIKHKSFVPAPQEDVDMPFSAIGAAIAESSGSGPSTTQRTSAQKTPKPPRGRKRPRAPSSVEAAEVSDKEIDGDGGNGASAVTSRRSARAKKVARGAYREVGSDGEEIVGQSGLDEDSTMADPDHTSVKAEPTEDKDIDDPPLLSNHPPQTSSIDLTAQLEAEEDESRDKPKMAMKLTHDGFTISRYKLCIIVQPNPGWEPTARKSQRAESLLPAKQAKLTQFATTGGTSRMSSMAPPPAPESRNERSRSETPAFRAGPPLFREPTPGLSGERGQTPLSSRGTPVYDVDNDGLVAMVEDDEDDTMEGLVRLTQSFQRAAPRSVLGGGNDDVDFDADADGMFGGDADE